MWTRPARRSDCGRPSSLNRISRSVAYSEELAGRIRAALRKHTLLAEKKMFGGICFMLRGNMYCGVAGDDLIVRVAPGEYSTALAKVHARVFDLSGKSMKNWVLVAPPGYESGASLKRWVDQGGKFALTLPPK